MKHKAAGVQHITFLSAYGMEHAPDKVAIRNVELDLLRRKKISHTILRPLGHAELQRDVPQADRRSHLPTGNGTEAFIDAEDIAAVGQTIKHVDLDRDAWIAGAIASGSRDHTGRPADSRRKGIQPDRARSAHDGRSRRHHQRLDRRMSISLRLAYFARRVASFASYSRALFGQNEIVAGSRETRRSWAKTAECHEGKRK
jgi:hypothetical protein